ncbi:MAG: right-handed parallel beta-helix repeat-containing protein [Planctomycetota bacterium]|jgi:hypothetical protein
MNGRKNLDTVLAICVFLAALAGPVTGRTIYVDPNGSADFTTIQAAIEDANDYDDIEVAPATYFEAINFNGKPVRVYSSGGREVTTIDATGLSSSVVTCDSGEDANTILEGFKITGGNASGMYNSNSSPTVTDCIFSSNTASSDGGGMYNNNSSPTVSDCNFGNNTANWGGGMYNYSSSPRITNCTFSSNEAATGGGGGVINYISSSPTMIDCNFSGNTAGTDGGAMWNSNGSSPTVTDCNFSNNSANGGAGMFNNDGSSPTLTKCTFSSNSATGIGARR